MDTGRGPQNARADRPWISETDLFVLGPLVTSDVYSMDTGRGPEQTGLEFLRLICFMWVVLYIVIRVIDIYIIDERRDPENTNF